MSKWSYTKPANRQQSFLPEVERKPFTFPDKIPVTSAYRVPFGKYKDKALRYIPTQYLLWLITQDGIKTQYPELYYYLNSKLRKNNGEPATGNGPWLNT